MVNQFIMSSVPAGQAEPMSAGLCFLSAAAAGVPGGSHNKTATASSKVKTLTNGFLVFTSTLFLLDLPAKREAKKQRSRRFPASLLMLSDCSSSFVFLIFLGAFVGFFAVHELLGM